MRTYRTRIFVGITLLILTIFVVVTFKKINLNPSHEIGDVIDVFNDVAVYYNGGVDTVTGRHLTKDGYNLGLKYQCVEFVKRYYYEALNHKMPDSYGHAKDFFDTTLKDDTINRQRNLVQYTNPSSHKPKVNDLLVYKGTLFNTYGHVAIITKVSANNIEIIQQNPGPFGTSRAHYSLTHDKGLWKLQNDLILGWLRKE